MDDPNYIPTGPTYGESDLGMRPTLSLEQLQMVARINWDRAILTERERCAKIAESNKNIRDPHSAYDLGYADAARYIAAAIRSGK